MQKLYKKVADITKFVGIILLTTAIVFVAVGIRARLGSARLGSGT